MICTISKFWSKTERVHELRRQPQRIQPPSDPFLPTFSCFPRPWRFPRLRLPQEGESKTQSFCPLLRSPTKTSAAEPLLRRSRNPSVFPIRSEEHTSELQ